MKNPFKTQGFDSIIGKSLVVNGAMTFNGVCVIDGTFAGENIKSERGEGKSNSVLIVNGVAEAKEVVMSDDLIISGQVTACTVRVEGTLALKSDCVLKAGTIYYRTLVAEPGAIIIGDLRHLDHSSDPLEI